MQRYPDGPVTAKFEDTWCFDRIGIENAACPAPGPATTIEAGVQCAQATRDTFGEFLTCREERQLIAGGAIATLAAAASGVAAAGVSWVAAASLGATAGAGLGLEVALYNKAKTKAYSDASVQLQCVIGDSTPLEGKFDQLSQNDLGSDSVTNESFDSTTQIDAALNALQNCEAGGHLSAIDDASYRLVAAEYTITKRREAYAKARLNTMGPDIVLSVHNIDVRAFAASQSGVPDPDQIEKGVQAVSVPMPSAKGAGAGGKAGGVPAAAAAPATCSSGSVQPMLAKIQVATAALNRSLEGIRLTDTGFPTCLAIKAYDEGSSSSSKSSSTSKTAGKSKSSGSSPSDDSSSTGGAAAKPSDSTPQAPPTKLAFQVMPSDNLNLDPDTSSATVKVTGGVAPYYAVAVDPEVSIQQATQTDPFVSYQVGLLPNAKKGGRLLVADQGGSLELVYVNPAPPKPANPPKPAAPAKPKAPKNPKPAAVPSPGTCP